MRKEAERSGAENREMITKMEELQLINDTSDKELKKLRTTKQVKPTHSPDECIRISLHTSVTPAAAATAPWCISTSTSKNLTYK